MCKKLDKESFIKNLRSLDKNTLPKGGERLCALNAIQGNLYANKNNSFGFGLEGHTGVMHDWATGKFSESSAQYINGNLVEGTNISNHSDAIDTQLFMYNQLGLRFRISDLCFTKAKT